MEFLEKNQPCSHYCPTPACQSASLLKGKTSKSPIQIKRKIIFGQEVLVSVSSAELLNKTFCFLSISILF